MLVTYLCAPLGTTVKARYALLINGLPGETNSTRCSLAVRRSLSAETEAAARRLRSLAIFSARVRRRRISGRRLGADIKFSLVCVDGLLQRQSNRVKSRDKMRAIPRLVLNLDYKVHRHGWQRDGDQIC